MDMMSDAQQQVGYDKNVDNMDYNDDYVGTQSNSDNASDTAGDRYDDIFDQQRGDE